MEDDSTTIKLDNHSMTVRIEGAESAEELMKLASEEMSRMEQERLRAELQEIEDYPQPTFIGIGGE
ncbi:hypothetical protein EXE51_05300 [Halorubrum sp. CGM5_25_10-8B]|uniref:hypothetical protein n=1 Tax=Halorubrum sp. CGM5_25_10-8B TaxID=2518115 RepID=UPI0010F5A2AA|nr:hypothetical protein [Halorubrum sp. CGM5_25_10-8B]TKX38007.1 hypothetical protein EXE51_05300 [Halorubrum sp. CGM5_25_10-8B]